MFWGCKILILPKSNQICPNLIAFAQILLQVSPNFASIFSKSNQICLSLINFAPLGDAVASPVPTALGKMDT